MRSIVCVEAGGGVAERGGVCRLGCRFVVSGSNLGLVQERAMLCLRIDQSK